MFRRRVMIIDDSVVARKSIAEAIAATADIEVAASAANGRIALAKLPRVRPDLVLLDVEMPEMDGLQTLAAIRATYPQLPVIMFSALTGRGAKITLDALALGANDYATKPSAKGGSMGDQLAAELFPKIRALCKGKGAPLTLDIPERAPDRPRRVREVPKVVVVGSSTGGPNALVEVIARLPQSFQTPILIVQHMPAIFTRLLAERLDQQTHLTVREAADGDRIEPEHVYVAPGDHHLTVVRENDGVCARLNQEPPENSCRPAVDVLFRSAARTYGSRTLALVLTGMGRDGLAGCQRLYAAGATILCQDEASSVVWGMPGYVAKANLADNVVPLTSIGEHINARTAQRPVDSASARETRS